MIWLVDVSGCRTNAGIITLRGPEPRRGDHRDDYAADRRATQPRARISAGMDFGHRVGGIGGVARARSRVTNWRTD